MAEPTTRSEFLRMAARKLHDLCGECARHEAMVLIEHACKISRSELIAHGHRAVSPSQRDRIEAFLSKRLHCMPLCHITESANFYGQTVVLTPDVLIPRPETEVLVEIILTCEKESTCFFWDIGTGSGAISCALCTHRPGWRCLATDISPAALRVAGHNCPTATVRACIDRCEAVKACAACDFIVSNPPYIARNAIGDLDKSVRDFEPHIALDGGIDGLDFYRYLAAQAHRHVKTGGRLYCEIGDTQGEAIRDLFVRGPWKNFRVFPDLTGRDRVIIAEKSG